MNIDKDILANALCDILTTPDFMAWEEFFLKYPELKEAVKDNDLFNEFL